MSLIKQFINNLLLIIIEVLLVNRMEILQNMKFIHGVCYRENFCVARHNIICFFVF